ncbi:MAG: DUF1501 domain-containing protein [Acidobacteria bacterium]|nr:DUF1501 domain-containing protein [Acidobacteriota bacterium]MDA1233211.1 DUF1501 domain-containing protein [Acidobacteriota bacterium]
MKYGHLFATRREMLTRCGMGMGAAALQALLSDSGDLQAAPLDGDVNPLASKLPPQFAKAKRVIHLFMNGGVSQVDTFDPKPSLTKYSGKPIPITLKTERRTGSAFGSPFEFKRFGQSGIEVSEIFSNVGECVDDLCVIRSMQTDIPNHEPSLMMMNCGDVRQIRPSFGSWVTYGLGSENQNLPGFIVLCPDGLPTQGNQNWRSAFLPGAYQATQIDTRETQIDKLIENIRNNVTSSAAQRKQLDLLAELNRGYQEERQNDGLLEARVQSFELAYRMQMEADDAFDLSKEPAHIHEMYGEGVQARQMMIARRLLEKGVRFVQVWHGSGQPWDSHDDIRTNHGRLARECDQPIAALLKDLKQRGMLEDTLVIWGGEFGRTPTVELPDLGANSGMVNGRDHNSYGFSMWLAGAGLKKGIVHGSTDEFGFAAAENKVHVHDLHATLLQLLGFNHQEFTYRYAGRDFRLTDVHGKVVPEILA